MAELHRSICRCEPWLPVVQLPATTSHPCCLPKAVLVPARINFGIRNCLQQASAITWKQNLARCSSNSVFVVFIMFTMQL